MERTKKTIEKRPDLILTADWHLREDTPVCYTWDWWADQWESVSFVSDLQEKYKCPVIHSGDLFHHWKPSPRLLSETSIRLPKEFYSVYGNHDLPQHNMELADKSGLHNLIVNGKVEVLDHATEMEGCSWNETPQNNVSWNPYKMLVWHVMTYQGKEPWPGCPAPKAAKLLIKHPAYDLIVTGDNHKSFVEEYEGRLLVNPGSLTRQTAGQINHEPSVYLYYSDTNSVKRVKIPQKDNVISREHIDVVDQRNDRIDAFILGLNADWAATMDFKENLERFRKKNHVKESVMQIIYKATDHEPN